MDVFLRVAQFMVLLFSGLNKEDPYLLLFIFENKLVKKRQKILKVKSPGQSINQGRGNLGAYLTFLRCQNLHQLRVPFFTIADKSMF